MGEKLLNCGIDGETWVELGEIKIKTLYLNMATPYKKWTSEEIVELLNDGMRFRILKEAEKIKKEIKN